MLGTFNQFVIEITSTNQSLATVLLLITLWLTINKMKAFNIIKKIKYNLLSVNYPTIIDGYDYLIIQQVRICCFKLKKKIKCCLSYNKCKMM